MNFNLWRDQLFALTDLSWADTAWAKGDTDSCWKRLSGHGREKKFDFPRNLVDSAEVIQWRMLYSEIFFLLCCDW